MVQALVEDAADLDMENTGLQHLLLMPATPASNADLDKENTGLQHLQHLLLIPYRSSV